MVLVDSRVQDSHFDSASVGSQVLLSFDCLDYMCGLIQSRHVLGQVQPHNLYLIKVRHFCQLLRRQTRRYGVDEAVHDRIRRLYSL